MKTISLKLPDELDAKVERLSRKRRLPRSQVIREAIEAFEEVGVSAADLAGDLVGCLSGPRDLSGNPDHMSGFGE